MLAEFIKIGFYVFVIFLLFCLVNYSPRLVAWFYGFKKQKHLVKNKDNKIAQNNLEILTAEE